MAEKTNESDRYRVDKWGSGYFSVDNDGAILAHTREDQRDAVRIRDIVQAMTESGFSDPMLLRFPQILAARQNRIFAAFASAIAEYGYTGRYQGVYPVKVNHDSVVVETLAENGFDQRFGLEVGSKAELCLALTVQLHPQAYIVCNGFKDRDYLELAVYAASHGRDLIVIAENYREIADIIQTVKKMGHRVRIGFRARLHSEGAGRWSNSSGNSGKFGLSTIEMVEGIEALRDANLIDDLCALHFHIGSQVNDILHIKSAIKEASRLFCAIARETTCMEILDLGGGLGVDYDGSRSASDWSVNYSIEEYARDAVYIVQDVCKRAKMACPTIVTESGRALTAFHAVIVLSSLRVVGRHTERNYDKYKTRSSQLEDMKETLEAIDDNNFRESFHDATQLLNEVLSGFRLGYVSLVDRALAECIHADICSLVRTKMEFQHHRTKDMVDLERQLAPKYVCNFSIFMSAPDSWAVQQVFPILPLDGLNSKDTTPATIGDITCDSDGRIDRFISEEGGEPQPYVWLHPPATGEEPENYNIGMFLIGAYQDVLGDFHNLFGTVNEGVVVLDGEGDFSLVKLIEGSSVEHSLNQFGYSPGDMVQAFDRQVDRERTPEAIQEFKNKFLSILHGNTYLQRMPD